VAGVAKTSSYNVDHMQHTYGQRHRQVLKIKTGSVWNLNLEKTNGF